MTTIGVSECFLVLAHPGCPRQNPKSCKKIVVVVVVVVVKDSEWKWHQLGHMQICTSLQTDNHASISPLSFCYRPDALPATQPTASEHFSSMETV